MSSLSKHLKEHISGTFEPSITKQTVRELLCIDKPGSNAGALRHVPKLPLPEVKVRFVWMVLNVEFPNRFYILNVLVRSPAPLSAPIVSKRNWTNSPGRLKPSVSNEHSAKG
jgi:hypothetical protein